VTIQCLKNKAHLSKHIETYTTSRLKIVRDDKDTIHFDGEPAIESAEVDYECNPKSLKVIVGDSFKAV
jgi:diacylglycerol kinase family enzyme